jgi:acyl transferase domain-containing protein
MIASATAGRPAGKRFHVVALSDERASALPQLRSEMLAWSRTASGRVRALDLGFTLLTATRIGPARCAAVVENIADLPKADWFESNAPLGFPAPRLTFMFPGQGVQRAGMARELYEQEPAFAATVDECALHLLPRLGIDLRRVLLAEGGDAQAEQIITQTRIAQPALFVLGLALADLLGRWGVKPVQMIGHSVGELVAATAAGVFSHQDALQLIAARGELMQSMPAGCMSIVWLSEVDLQRRLPADLCLAAVNTDSLCVVAGEAAEVAAFEASLARENVQTRRLKTSHAFHSRMMDPVVKPFRNAVAAVRRHRPAVPFVSSLTGRWVEPAQACSPDYWAAQLRGTVRFAAGVRTVLADGADVLLELGPSRSLVSLLPSPQLRPGILALHTLGQPSAGAPATRALAQALARLWVHGVPIDWNEYFLASGACRIYLPLSDTASGGSNAGPAPIESIEF